MIYSGSPIKNVQLIVQYLISNEITHVVISPGSRNAPLSISFGNISYFKVYSAIDERSAGFMALGMARELQKPVVLLCTSGTAGLNYAPALAEAFYQEIPLLAITADRPPELIDQEDGQTIHQIDVFKNFVGYSAALNLGETPEQLNSNTKKIIRGLERLTDPVNQPVHINIPFKEPLYNFESKNLIIPKLEKKPVVAGNVDFTTLNSCWEKSAKVLIVSGINTPNAELNKLLEVFSEKQHVPVLASASSNLKAEGFIWNIDTLIKSIEGKEEANFAPDLLFTIGQSLVSKPLKQHLRKVKPKWHIDIDENPREVNTYGCLTQHITAEPAQVLQYALDNLQGKDPSYMERFLERKELAISKKNEELKNLDWSDLLAFKTITENLTPAANVHLANSTPVRYMDLFEPKQAVNYYSNRGTSGIDGCTSTALGAAKVSEKLQLLITGDISFLYDSNAFLNTPLPKNLRIILINNGGGNIFRFIPGPSDSKRLDLFETPSNVDFEKLCDAYHITYLEAANSDELHDKIQDLLHDKMECTLLEVKTPAEASAIAFKTFLR